MACVTQGLDLNQVIAYNLMRIRKTLGESQEQAAERLEPHLGVRWSKAVYSAAERSYAGKRVRQFTAADVAAFAAAFQVPLLYFFLPPKPEDRHADGVMIAGRLISWPDLLNVMLDGKQQGAFQLRLFELPSSEWPSLNYLPRPGMTHAEARMWLEGLGADDRALFEEARRAVQAQEQSHDHGT